MVGGGALRHARDRRAEGRQSLDIDVDIREHRYGPDPVLQGIRLKAHSGEIVAILGPSGCGKSTLLRLAGGIEPPTEGNVTFASGQGRRQGVAYVFQDPTLLPWRTALGNVAFPLEHGGGTRSAIRDRALAALHRVGLADFAAHYPRQLSGGMQQRVGLARALATDPALLLLDEPFAAADALTREALVADLVRLWAESRYTCLYVTHSPDEAVRLGHRVVVLSERPGRIRGIVPVDPPIERRHAGEAALQAAGARVWALVRGDAGAGAAHAG